MIKISALTLVLFVAAGCTATPIDFLIPTPKPSPATTEYLGHLYRTNNVNRMYHSLTDTKLEKNLVPIRKMELQGLHLAAKGETELIDAMGSKMSNGLWSGVTALLVAGGIMTPRPQEKHKIKAAGMDNPEKYK